MNITKELESLKGLVMDRKSIDLTDRIYIRGLINEILAEAKEEEKFEVPEWVTIQPKNIGADR